MPEAQLKPKGRPRKTPEIQVNFLNPKETPVSSENHIFLHKNTEKLNGEEPMSS